MPEMVAEHIIEYSIDDLQRVAGRLIQEGERHDVWLFYGNLGAGKTTLIKEVCIQLGIDGDILSSPTFSIINEYPAPTGRVFHFDFYRIKNEMEILDLGTEEYFSSGNFCFIEWPERLGSLVPDSYFKIRITENGTNSRTIEYEKHG